MEVGLPEYIDKYKENKENFKDYPENNHTNFKKF